MTTASTQRAVSVGGEAGRRRLILVHESPWAVGGSQRSMLAEAEGLRDAGWDLTLVHAGRHDAPLSPHPFACAVSIPEVFDRHWRPAMQSGLRVLARLVAEVRPVAVHLHLWSGPWLIASVLGEVPVVVTAHVPICPNGARFRYGPRRLCETPVGRECFTEGLRRDGCATTGDGLSFGAPAFAGAFAYAAWSLRLLTRCDAVIAPSAWQRSMLIADGVDDTRVTVLPPPIPGVDDGSATTRRAPPVVLAAGRLTPLKGFDHLLEASAGSAVPHEVRIAGCGPAEPALRRLAVDRHIKGRVSFLGDLEGAALADEYRRAHVVVVPSLWPETFGMVGPEALIAGTAVVAYGSGGVPDWATPQSGAVCVPSGDVEGLTRALNDALARSPGLSLAQRRDAAARVSPELHTARLVDLYERLR